MVNKKIYFVFMALSCSSMLAGVKTEKQLKDYCSNLPFAMPVMTEPQFPDYVVNIKDFGGISDGHTVNTKAIAAAITACVNAGGGTVVIPPGTWLTGPIKLESNINLHVEKGALVQFTKTIEDYPFVQGTNGNFWRVSQISASGAKNIAITGEGIFDGAGEYWRYVLKEDLTEWQWKHFLEMGGFISPDGKAWWPSKEAYETDQRVADGGRRNFGREDYEKTKEFFRPNLVSFFRCTDIVLDGPTFENSPRYHIIPTQCENLIFRNIKVLSPAYGKNTDGIDPASCRNVVIYNCTVDVGDDGICLKPGNKAEGRTEGAACENIVVADCVVYHAHGGFVIGSESFGGARNVMVRNCNFIGTDVGLRFKSVRGRGGVIENIYFDGIQMRDIASDAILFDMYYAGGAPLVEAQRDLTIRSAEPVTHRTPQFKNFYVKNIVCNGADRAVVINGLPEMTIKNMTLENVEIASQRGVFIADADGVQLNGCRIVPRTGPVLTIISSANIVVKSGSYPAFAEIFAKVYGERSENIRFEGIDLKHVKKIQDLDKNVKANAVLVE